MELYVDRYETLPCSCRSESFVAYCVNINKTLTLTKLLEMVSSLCLHDPYEKEPEKV